MTRLTNEGTAGFASISPDGKYVVYAKGERGEVSLWIRQVASSADVMVIPPSDVVIEGSTFSHDGNYLYYTASLPDAPVPTVYRIPVIGGTAPRKIIGDVYGAVALSPDDKRLAFLRGFPTGEEALFVANADGSQERMLTKRDGQNLFYLTRGASPAWSPDGSVIVCPDGSTSDGFKIGFVAVSADDPQERLIMKRTFEDVGRVVWYPNGRGLLFCGSEEGKPLQIMYMSYPARTVSRITNDLLEYGPHSLSVTQDGSVIVSAQTSASATVMIAPDGDGSRIREITKGMTRTDGMTGIAWTNDQRIIYSTTRGVTGSLWTSRTDGGDGTQLTFVPSSNPAVSMATGDVYYVAAPDGALPNIWRMKSTGADPVRLTSAEEYNPDVSLDGQWVVFDSWQSGARGVWKMRTDNSEPATIFLPRATTPRISPDGKFVACRAYDEAEKRERMAIVSFSEGNVVARFDLPLTAGTFHWAPDGKGIHYVDTRKGVSNIWMIDYRNNSTKQISTFTSGRIFSFAWSPDGKQLAVSRGQATSDVVMLTMNE
jgi:Tol biopolymer transport system component